MRLVSKVLLVATIALSVGLCAAATNDLRIAREALRDGLWEIARVHAAQDGTRAGKLVVLESWAGEKKWDKVGETLKGWKDEQGPEFDYYRAVVRGDHAAAMEILKKGGSAEGCVEAKMLEADVLDKKGDHAGAEQIWRGIAADTNMPIRVLAIVGANLQDETLLRRAYAELGSVSLRRAVGLRLGALLLREPKTLVEGEGLIRTIVKDSPDAEGAREAFLALADAALVNEQWEKAGASYREAIEIWPDVARLSSVQEGRGWALQKLGRRDEALEMFKRAGELATTDEVRAKALVLEGDVLQEMGQEDAATARYRSAIERFPATVVAKKIKSVVDIRELEARGKECYRNLKFAEAMSVFADVAKADAARAPRMDFYSVLCLYGQGQDDEACRRVRTIAASCADESVRAEAMLWLAKFLYNRRAWKESCKLFLAYADEKKDSPSASESLLWAARACFADADFSQAILIAARLADVRGESRVKAQALLVQGESLIELARFDEAVLVFDRVAVTEGSASEDRIRAQVLKADALYEMGADNSARYEAALEAYRAVRFGSSLSPSEQIVVSFKIGRVLEKLKRLDEACDQYYTQVVLAYRDGRLTNVWFNEESRAAFSRAAFRLADEYESRGRDHQAVSVLELVVRSDVPAAEEAARRIGRIVNKGRML